eukprot:9125932-Alexandrium_andersonii.AAC.1
MAIKHHQTKREVLRSRKSAAPEGDSALLKRTTKLENTLQDILKTYEAQRAEALLRQKQEKEAEIPDLEPRKRPARE